jgi:acetoacetyl-CoA synthetase
VDAGLHFSGLGRLVVGAGEPAVRHGRLNRNGVRLGSADIHDIVERLPEIAEALVIG